MAKPFKPKPQEEEIQTQDNEWEEINTSETAYKLNPGDDVVFVMLEQPKVVKNGTASVFHAKIKSWNNHSEFNGETILLYVQKIPTETLISMINEGKIELGKTLVRLINQGRKQGTRYYSYKIMVKPSGQQ